MNKELLKRMHKEEYPTGLDVSNPNRWKIEKGKELNPMVSTHWARNYTDENLWCNAVS